jgi:hypothetical protein
MTGRRHTRREPLEYVALMCLAGGFAGVVARSVLVLNEALFQMLGNNVFVPSLIHPYSLPEALLRAVPGGSLSGLLPGALHGILCKRWTPTQILLTIVFWAAVGPAIHVLTLLGDKVDQWVWDWFFVSAAFPGAVFGALLALLGKGIVKVLYSDEQNQDRH